MDDPIWPTTSGAVRGFWDEGAAVFLGVPFAAPPRGELRFSAPRPPEPWTGVRDAVTYGASAPQPDRQFTLIPEPLIAGDNCLNLNIFTPELGAASLPVLVWIHGGGFEAGCNASPWYRGTRFARDGVVVVAVNYRLGIDGFLSVDDAPDNRGVLDWLAALGWVRDNIAGFGGDPSNVTIAGQSAGGLACATLLAVPTAAGLFHRAILMSGAGQGLASADGALTQRRVVGEALGAPVTRTTLAEQPQARVFEAMATLAERANRNDGVPWLLGPVVDGDLVAERPIAAARAGSTNGVELLVGVTAEEMNAALKPTAPQLDDDARYERRLARAGLAGERRRVFLAAHPGAPRWEVLGQATTDRLFRAATAHLAEARAEAGAPVFAYEFRWRSAALGGLGACHCLDVPFAFDVLDGDGVAPVLGDAPPQDLADTMHRSWVDFVTTGDAGWERYDTSSRSAMAFAATSGVVSDPWQVPRCVWPDPT